MKKKLTDFWKKDWLKIIIGTVVIFGAANHTEQQIETEPVIVLLDLISNFILAFIIILAYRAIRGDFKDKNDVNKIP